MSRFRSHKINHPKKQKGAALLLFVLLLVVGASTLLVSKLNKAATQYYRDDVTMKALLKAKEALIGFAVTYPDNPAFSDRNAGPGFLPCPDTNGNGSPNPPCGSLTDTTFQLGRFPWEYIGVDEIRDSSGESLWYSLSNNFRNNPKRFPLNSESLGELTIDGSTDIVAVIMAPSFSLEGQNRPSNTASDYLEDDNNDSDSDFVSTMPASSNFNDQVLVVTRHELMAAVEKRVLGEAATILKNYQQNMDNLTTAIPDDGMFPWLSPFSDPKLNSTSFDGIPLTYEGLLPIHIQNEEFITSFNVTWNLLTSNVTPLGAITQAELESGTQTVSSGRCRWKEDTFPPPTPSINGVNTIECQGNVTNGGKTYTFDFGFTEGISFNGSLLTPGIHPPTSTSVRTRDVIVNSLPIQSSSTPLIQISDGISTGTVSIENPSTGSIQLTGISYDLNASPGQEEIPQWFIKNNWHHLIYVAESNGHAPGGSGTCIVGSNCLTIDGLSPNNAGVIVISAGMELAGQTRTVAPAALASYFENSNNTILDDDFIKNTYPPDTGYDPNLNDQIRIVTP
ncbi:MAG: hypothetical protein AB8D52_03790 [Gammaproteobacteria bacterium]